MPEKSGLQFTSSLTKKEYIAALAYLPVHVIGIPSLVAVLIFGVSDLLTLKHHRLLRRHGVHARAVGQIPAPRF